jgi:hypothetical protein
MPITNWLSEEEAEIERVLWDSDSNVDDFTDDFIDSSTEASYLPLLFLLLLLTSLRLYSFLRLLTFCKYFCFVSVKSKCPPLPGQLRGIFLSSTSRGVGMQTFSKGWGI